MTNTTMSFHFTKKQKLTIWIAHLKKAFNLKRFQALSPPISSSKGIQYNGTMEGKFSYMLLISSYDSFTKSPSCCSISFLPRSYLKTLVLAFLFVGANTIFVINHIEDTDNSPINRKIEKYKSNFLSSGDTTIILEPNKQYLISTEGSLPSAKWYPVE